MMLYLVKDSVHEFESRFGYCDPSNLRCLNEEAETTTIVANDEEKNKVSTKTKMEKLTALVTELFKTSENGNWDLKVAVQIYETEVEGAKSEKMNIRLEGTILQALRDLLYVGDKEKLKIQFSSTVNVYLRGYRNRGSRDVAAINNVVTFHTVPAPEPASDQDSRYEAVGIEVPMNVREFISRNEGDVFDWVLKTTIAIDVSDFITLDGLIPDLCEAAKSLWSKRKYCDLRLIAGDNSQTKAHKDILAVHSSVFAAKFETKLEEGDEDESFKNKLHLPEMSKDGVEALLKFIYCRDVKKPMAHSSIALELFQAGHKYHIPCMEKAMRVILLDKSHEWYDSDVAFRVFTFARLRDDQDLKLKILAILKKKMRNLEGSELFNGMFPNEAARDLLLLSLSSH